MFSQLRQPRVLEVIPSVTASANQARELPQPWPGVATKGDLGASVKYGITSTITLDATVNPDFSQVESDAFQVQVNQRYPIFYSEKRPFFMCCLPPVPWSNGRSANRQSHRTGH